MEGYVLIWLVQPCCSVKPIAEHDKYALSRIAQSWAAFTDSAGCLRRGRQTIDSSRAFVEGS